MKKILIPLLAFFISLPSLQGQNNTNQSFPDATSATERWEGYQQRLSLQEQSLVKNIPFRNVGPTVMSGRVVDLEVDPDDPTHFYAAFASGGLWETTNEGASFTPLFQNEIVMTIGDIAVDWKNEVIYVGSGENNSSRSSYSGYGLFKSTDGGSSWTHLGLPESHHIGRILIDPRDPNTLVVGVLGKLYSTNEERGIYKSRDGGKTWQKTLFVDEQSGVVDIARNPANPDELIAASWQKDRKAWNFVEAGAGSGIFKSTDNGETWANISEGKSGFPDTQGMGRVGIDFGPNGDVFVVLDNQDRRKSEDDQKQGITKDMLRDMSTDDFLALANEKINDFLDDNGFPQKYNAVDIKSDIRSDKVKPIDLVRYLEDANSLLFDTPVKGGEVYKSTDGGESWAKTHEGYIDSFVFSYGYYFGQIRVDQKNPDNVYIMGVPLLASADGGKTWNSISKANVHADHHALWVNPNRSGHLINGNDGGINISYDNGDNWIHCNSLPVGQFYAVNVDMEKPYNVYGGLQDNGVWKGPSDYTFSPGWYSNGRYPYERLMGGDGMKVAIDTRNNDIVYTGYQFGNYFRINTANGKRVYVTPSHELGEAPYRWNWQSPIMLSSHNQDIVYFGSNKFHRSMNQGDDWETLSDDLTQGGKKGDVSFGTLSTITESPLRFGLIYVGSDDGLVHVSKDAGQTWTNITGSLPEDFWISRVEASKHVEGRVYVSLNGYRWDHFKPMVYVSDDFGSSWKNISEGLPREPVNVVREDPVNEDLIYVGTDHGTYVSLDRGNKYMLLEGGMPAVAVHDLVIHPRENELVVGTHGRSIYIGDVSHLQQLTDEILQKRTHLFAVEGERYSNRWGSKGWAWGEVNESATGVVLYAKDGGTRKMTVKQGDLTLFEKDVEAETGLNFLEYRMLVQEDAVKSYRKIMDEKWAEDFKEAENGRYYLVPGTYTITVGDSSTTLKIEAPRERPPRKG